MSDIHPQTPVELAAQVWCDPENADKVFDASLADSIVSRIADEQRLSSNWYETAAQFARNADYYRGLCEQIGEAIGDEAYIADDGSRSDDVLCAKLPELVRAIVSQHTNTGAK